MSVGGRDVINVPYRWKDLTKSVWGREPFSCPVCILTAWSRKLGRVSMSSGSLPGGSNGSNGSCYTLAHVFPVWICLTSEGVASNSWSSIAALDLHLLGRSAFLQLFSCISGWVQIGERSQVSVPITHIDFASAILFLIWLLKSIYKWVTTDKWGVSD